MLDKHFRDRPSTDVLTVNVLGLLCSYLLRFKQKAFMAGNEAKKVGCPTKIRHNFKLSAQK